MKTSTTQSIGFYSEILEKKMPMQLYLPADYDSVATLPTLYFLHGRSGNEHCMQIFDISQISDNLTNENIMQPLLIVCPRMEYSRGVNSAAIAKTIPDPTNGGRTIQLGRYEDYLIEEIIPFIDKTFKTIGAKEGRYIGGVSARGYAALHNAFRHADLFSKVGGHIPSLELEMDEESAPFYENREAWEAYNPLNLAETAEIPRDLQVYLDAGDTDEGRFFEGCKILYNQLKKRGITVENHLFQGNHSAEYIRANMAKYLRFYGSKPITTDMNKKTFKKI
ncbi:MAG: esterase family protein [Bacteroidales bacterium]|jgi:enterochelin esterase-like enzyme|nr:esterase family protein [Bacteroidales bacterium]